MRYLRIPISFQLLLLLLSSSLAAGADTGASPTARESGGATATVPAPTSVFGTPALALDQVVQVRVVPIRIRDLRPELLPFTFDISGVLYRPSDGSVRSLENTRISLAFEKTKIDPNDTHALQQLLRLRGVLPTQDALNVVNVLNYALDPQRNWSTPQSAFLMPRIESGPVVQKALTEGYLVTLLIDYEMQRFSCSIANLVLAAQTLPNLDSATPPFDSSWESFTKSVWRTVDILDFYYAFYSLRSIKPDGKTWWPVINYTDQLATIIEHVTDDDSIPLDYTKIPLATKDVSEATRLEQCIGKIAGDRTYLGRGPCGGLPSATAVMVNTRVKVVYPTNREIGQLAVHYVPKREYPKRRNERLFRGVAFQDHPAILEEDLVEADYCIWAEKPSSSIGTSENASPVSEVKAIRVRRSRSGESKPVELAIP